jgi:hypothetical protein
MLKKNDIFKFVSMEKDNKMFPYQNRSLKNIPGERWKDIPDFEGLYKVSNYGRIIPSMYEAQKHTGIDQREISCVVNGRIHICKGYFWRLGYKTKRLNLAKITRKKGQGEVIHKSLMKRLRIRKINNDQLPPLLNLSTKTMKGEKWKDLPYYEGLYQISNFGRIKSLRRISDGKIQKWLPEQIKRLTVDFRKDEDGKEVAGSTIINLSKNNQKKDFSVSRLVYYAFVKKIDLENRNIRVYYKDGISINFHYKNLFLQKAGWAINKK